MLAVLLGGLWLLLNNAGGSDLAKAPPYFFATMWWGWALWLAWSATRAPQGLWNSLDRSLKLPAIALFVFCLLNLGAAAGYADAGQLAPLAWTGWIWWISLVLSGVLLTRWLQDDTAGLAPVILQTVLLLGSLIAVHGLLDYFQANATQPLRGVFAWHNPAGGYFVLLLPIALSRALGERVPKVALIYGAIALLLGIALLATNSRGAWLTGLIGVTYLVARLGWSRLALPWRLGALGAAVVLAILLPFIVGGPLTPIRDRIISLTATRDFSVEGRGAFYQTAWRLFVEGPSAVPESRAMAVLGTGFSTYRFLSPLKQTDPRYYSSDPHSFFFQWLVELGIVGLAGCCLLWGWWGWVQWGTPLLRMPSPGAAPAAPPLWAGQPLDLHGITAGLLAGWLHWLIDFDATYMLIVWTAITLMAIVVATLRTQAGAPPLWNITPQLSEVPAGNTRLREWRISQLLGSLLLLGLLAGAATSTLFAASKFFYDRAEDAFQAWERQPTLDLLPRAQSDYALAAALWPYDGDGWRGLSVTELWLGTQAMPLDPVIGTQTLLEARKHAVTATKFAAYNARNWNNLAQVDAALLRAEAMDQATAANNMQVALITAITRDPLNNPRYYIQLTQALSLGEPSENRDRAIVLNIERLMQYYPPAQIGEFSKTRLDWQHLPLSYAQVWPFYLLALRSLEDAKGIQRARSLALEAILPALKDSEYVPLEVKAKVLPVVRQVVDEIDSPTGAVVLTPELLQALQGFGASEEATEDS